MLRNPVEDIAQQDQKRSAGGLNRFLHSCRGNEFEVHAAHGCADPVRGLVGIEALLLL
jgi:hypothetical protein